MAFLRSSFGLSLPVSECRTAGSGCPYTSRTIIVRDVPNGGDARAWVLATGLRRATVLFCEVGHPTGRHPAAACRRAGWAGTFDAMENSAALVTGANKGIGKEIARQLAAAGFAVWVGSRDAARGERAVEEIGGDARLLVLDVTDAASIAYAARQAVTLDILVNNAGISGDGETADRDDVGTLRRIYETNVFGVVAVTNAFLPALRRSAHPRIVNISSGTGSLAWATGAQFPHPGQLRRLPVVQGSAERADRLLRPRSGR